MPTFSANQAAGWQVMTSPWLSSHRVARGGYDLLPSFPIGQEAILLGYLWHYKSDRPEKKLDLLTGVATIEWGTDAFGKYTKCTVAAPLLVYA